MQCSHRVRVLSARAKFGYCASIGVTDEIDPKKVGDGENCGESAFFGRVVIHCLLIESIVQMRLFDVKVQFRPGSSPLLIRLASRHVSDFAFTILNVATKSEFSYLRTIQGTIQAKPGFNHLIYTQRLNAILD